MGCDRCDVLRLAGALRCERCAGGDGEPPAAVPGDRRAVPAPGGAGEGSQRIDLRAIQVMLGEPRPAARRQASPLERRLSLALALIMLCALGLAGVLLLRELARPGPTSLLPRIVVEVPGAGQPEPPRRRVARAAAPTRAVAAAPVVVRARATAPRRRGERRGDVPRSDIEVPRVPAIDPSLFVAAERYALGCLIDPAKCRVAGPAGLPATLEPVDIGAGTRIARAAAARQCRPLAKGGEAVRIKLTIAGPTGAVVRATPESLAGNPYLAVCCAQELAAASFPRVERSQVEASVTVRF